MEIRSIGMVLHLSGYYFIVDCGSAPYGGLSSTTSNLGDKSYPGTCNGLFLHTLHQQKIL